MLFLLALADHPEDADFLEGIYHTHHRLLYGQALQVLRHREDAEDVVQAAMLKLTKKIHILRGLERNKLVSYLVITVRNTAINLYRQRQVRTAHEAAVPLHIIPDAEATGPEAQALDRDGVERVKAAIRRLPPRERDAMVLRYVQGLADSEVADALGIQAVSARALLSRGRRRLKEYLMEGRG